MGFFLGIVYFVTYYLTPIAIFGPLAAARVELILAALVLLISFPSLARPSALRTPQSLALVGLAFIAFLSVLIEVRWLSGAVQAFLTFIPNAFAYFIVGLHCTSKKRLQIAVLMLLFVCLFVIAQGSIALHRGVPAVSSHDVNSAESMPASMGSAGSPYLLAMADDKGKLFYRLRGLGEINDPNDFGQLIACVIPLTFIFWRRKRAFRNFVFVLLPVCLLLYGMYLTHSRGALLALTAMAVVAARRRIGTLPALMLAAGIFAGAMAMHFTGGRDITAEAGSDRTELWSNGLQILKSRPLLGVGLGGMPNYTDSHHTAHNSVVVCAAELGFLGLYFWSMFLLPTLRDALALAFPKKANQPPEDLPEAPPGLMAASELVAIDKAEIIRLGRLLVLSLTGYLVSGWFLSRALVMTFFLLGGMVEVVYEMAWQRGMITPRMRLKQVLPYSGILAVSLVGLMYVMLRVLNHMH